MESVLSTCPKCGATVVPTQNFCPICGTQLREAPVGISRQIYVYIVSALLPPFGLMYTWKYRHQARGVGIAAAVITIISLILTIWLSIGFVQNIQSQINTYSNLGL